MTWQQLRTAYGDATELPGSIARLGSSTQSERAAALMDVEGCIAHQGTVYSASGPAIPLILDVLEAPGTQDRMQIARLLGRIAWGRAEEEDATSEGEVAAALERAEPRLIALLDDPDPGVRAMIVRSCTKVATRPLMSAAIVAHLTSERDDSVRYSLIYAPTFGGDTSTTWHGAAEALLASREPAEHLAGALALATLGPSAPSSVVGPILEAMKDPGRTEPAWKKSAWAVGSFALDLANIASKLGAARAPTLVPAMTAMMETSGDAAGGIAEAVLFMTIGEATAPADASALDAVTRDALLAIVACDAAWPAFAGTLPYVELPASRDGLGVYLGLPSRLVVEREVAGQRIWQLAKTQLAAEQPLADLFATLALSRADELAAIGEMLDGAHDLNEAREELRALFESRVAALAVLPDAERSTLAAEVKAALVPDLSPAERWRSFRILAALDPGPFDARFDALLPTAYSPELHARVPAGRLEPLVFAALCATARGLGEPDEGWGIGFANPARDAARFLAVCPSERLAKLVLGLASLSGIGGDAVGEVEKYAAHAVVKRALDEHEPLDAAAESYAEAREAFASWLAPAFD